jgi:ABC-type phosphate transport system auxiliary subunit
VVDDVLTPDGSYSLDTLLRFLKYAGMEGLINPASARSRRNAAEHLGRELLSEEREDMRRVDVSELASRFHKLEESSVRSEAVELYVQRLELALVDFFAWMDDPADFNSVGAEQQRSIRRHRDGRSAIDRDQEAAERIALEATDNPSNIIPVPLSDHHVVYIANLPLRLSSAEADKITRVVQAYIDQHDGSEKDGSDR